MSEWKEYKLGDVLNFRRGHDLPKYDMIEGNIPVAGSNGIIGYHNTKTVISPCITIGRSGNVGTPHIYDECWAHNTTLYIDDYKDNYPIFIYYFLKILNLANYGGGSAVPTLNRNHIHPISIIFPTDINEQKEIAGILSSLDAKIDLLNRQNSTLEAMAETLFRQYFIENPKPEWASGIVSDIVKHSRIAVNPQKNKEILFHHYSIPSFDNGKKPICELGAEIQSGKYSIPKYSILFSKLNPHKDKRIWLLLNNVDENSICSTEFQVIKPKDNDYLFFVYGWLSYNENYNKIASGVGGTSSSHQRIDPATIFSGDCPIVDSEQIKVYNNQVRHLFEKQINNQLQILTLTKLRDTLLPKLMNNEIKVL